ncbi:MAG: glycosyltransferase family 4 protein, partial [Saprospiraceae bacterium]|nr:glycosyltransferase family 4 protein [Saprospiraceae bacterium]
GGISRVANLNFTSIDFYKKLLKGVQAEAILLPVGSNIPAVALSAAERERLRKKWFPEAAVVLSTFGQRNLSGLLEALARLEAKGQPLGLLACGTSPQAFRERAFKNVRATGFLPAQEISHCLQLSDVFVLPDFVGPSGEGGSCNKSGSLAAAFEAGLPVVGTRGDMNNALLRHGENIWLAENDSPDALEEAIELLLSQADIRRRLGLNGKQLFQQELDWSVLAGKLLHHLKHADDQSDF